MPKLIENRNGGIRFMKTKWEVAEILERYRTETGKNKKDFADLLGITGEAYNHILRGAVYPNFKSLSILNQNGFNVGLLLGLNDKDVAKIRAGKYDK